MCPCLQHDAKSSFDSFDTKGQGVLEYDQLPAFFKDVSVCTSCTLSHVSSQTRWLVPCREKTCLHLSEFCCYVCVCVQIKKRLREDEIRSLVTLVHLYDTQSEGQVRLGSVVLGADREHYILRAQLSVLPYVRMAQFVCPVCPCRTTGIVPGDHDST